MDQENHLFYKSVPYYTNKLDLMHYPTFLCLGKHIWVLLCNAGSTGLS